MSVSHYKYDPEICDGDYCPGVCDCCSKRFLLEIEEERDDEEEENAD